tara:strand:- start:47370 stop:48128 length:759 start_codon:yes stop_codon:yes gene_type:complete
LLSDPYFYAVSIPAVLLFGIAKGGFGGALGVASVPLMSLVMSPVQAAGILLPVLCMMDLISVWAYRGKWAWPELRMLVPAALIGIVVGTLMAGYLSAASIKLIVGVVALSFIAHHLYAKRRDAAAERKPVATFAGIPAGAAAGFTSFIAHSGGPPLSMYLLRRPLNRTQYVATAAVFFTTVNYVKLVPYGWLGQLSTDNLTASLILAPFGPIGVALGIFLHKRVSDRLFFRIAYIMLFVVALKLINDGIKGA